MSKRTAKPKTVTRDVSVYMTDAGEFLVERSNGTMTVALTSRDVTEAVKEDDRVISKRRRAIVITRLTWHPAFVTTGGAS